MTSATDELRRLLDERGIDCQTHYMHAAWYGWPKMYAAMDNCDGTLTVDNLTPEQAIAATLESEINGRTSDGYHTFNELYHHRAVLFSVIVRDHQNIAWKSRKHHDGTMYDDMFIVGIETPDGQATYHYDLDPYWDMFDCEERESAPEWDGHTPDEAIARIATLGSGTCRMERIEKEERILHGWLECSNCGPVYPPAANGIQDAVRYCPSCGARVER